MAILIASEIQTADEIDEIAKDNIGGPEQYSFPYRLGYLQSRYDDIRDKYLDLESKFLTKIANCANSKDKQDKI